MNLIYICLYNEFTKNARCVLRYTFIAKILILNGGIAAITFAITDV